MKKIIIVGSLNMDLVINAPYAPVGGETLMGSGFMVNPGGKGANQASAIAKLGGKVKMIGKVGSDAYGPVMKNNLASYGVDVEDVTTADGNSGVALIIVVDGDNRIILDPGANYKVTKEDVDVGLSKAKSGDILIMQLEVPMDIVTYASDVAKQKGMTVILNPAPAVKLGQDLLCNVDIITPNETETEILTGISPDSEVELALAVKEFYKYGIKNVVITMGSRGAVVTYGNNIVPIEARKVKAVDTTSAGDTYVGAIAVKLDMGVDIVTACKFASVASSVTVTRAGAAQSIPTLAEVEEIMVKEGRI
jgi:ribokinase